MRIEGRMLSDGASRAALLARSARRNRVERGPIGLLGGRRASVGSRTGSPGGFSAAGACISSRGLGGRRPRPREGALQTSAAGQLDLVQPARDWQARKLGQIAFGATVLFLAQLYLAPAQWFPETKSFHLAMVLSVLALAGITVHRLVTNKPIWMGWRSALLAIYCVAALVSPVWSIDRAVSVEGGLEVAKHFLFFVAVVNTLTTPQRIRTALFFYAVAAIVPGWGTFWNWWHDELLVAGFRGRWLGVMGDPNHDSMALVGALPLLLYFATHGPGLWRRVIGVLGVTA